MPALLHAQRTGSLPATIRILTKSALLGATVGSVVIVAILTAWLAPEKPLLAVLSCIPVFSALGSVKASELNARRRFISAALAPAYGAIGGVAILLLTSCGPMSLATALAAFEAVRFLALATLLRIAVGAAERGGQARDTPRELRSRIRQSIGWQAVGAALISLNPLIDILFARTIGQGAVSFIEYAGRLWNAVPLLFSGPLLLAYFRWSSEDSRRSFQLKHAKLAALKAAGVALALTPFACLLVPPIIAALFGLGVMAQEDQGTLASLLVFYILGTAPLAGGLFLARAFSAAGKVHVLALAALAGFVVNVLGDWILPQFLSLNGIGLATTLSYTASFVVMLTFGSKRPFD